MNLLLVSGCVSTSFVEVRHKGNGFSFPFQKNLNDDEPQISDLTKQIIEKENLNTGIAFKRSRQIQHLERSYQNSPSSSLAQSLAELHYVTGQKKEHLNKKQSQESYFKSLVYSYRFFFDDKIKSVEEPGDEQIYHMRKLYNKSLENYLRIVSKKKLPFMNRQFTVRNGNQSYTLTIDPSEWTWKPEELDHFEFVSDYKVNGIENIHKTTGLGVPLIAVRRPGTSNPEIEKHYARGISFPITAFMHLDADSGENSSNTQCRLVLYDPHQKRAVTIDDREVTLETDLTTPLAYFMQKSRLKGIDHLGLIRPDKAQKIAGIYMLRPFQKDKIPVLMIHGLWSSPQTWLEAYNDLQAIPEIDEKYQFWFYLYPSGKPFIETAADLREDLKEMRSQFDPNEDNPELDNMVMVGHSMGGLIAKAVTVESGDKYWDAISRVPLNEIKASENNKDAIKRVLFFDSNSSINRIITVATPHRGSQFSNGPSRWLIRRLVTLPSQTLQLSKSLLLNNPKAFRDSKALTGRTSIDSLAPDNPILKILRRTEYDDGIKHHNIVGVLGLPKSVAENSKSSLGSKSDGVVSYDSAHDENAESELIVQANHSSVQKHKDTIKEIHRILMLHSQEVGQQGHILQVSNDDLKDDEEIEKEESEFPVIYQSQSLLKDDFRASRPLKRSANKN
jgi:pimeloyl-ACP methyl ester carboxylesterase